MSTPEADRTLHPAPLDATIVDGGGAFAETRVAGPTPARTTLPAGAVRTTVLPRVEMIGAEPRLVESGRNRYERTRLLGEGGAGQVAEARDNDIGRTVALKRLHPDLHAPEHIARFVDEIRLVGQLEHPHIVPIHDVGVDEQGAYFFVMKYVDGDTLEQVIAKLAAGDADYHRRYPIERRVELFIGVLEAVRYAHARGVVHRDIKPANVMVGPYGEVMLMDWGIARQLGKAELPARPDAAEEDRSPSESKSAGATTRPFETRVGSILGTPLYMSPEQARGEPVDERSDVYSLSMLFYELLALRHPFADRPNVAAVLTAVLTEEPPMAFDIESPHQGRVPAELGWFLKRGLAKAPAERFSSVSEMIERLRRRAGGEIEVECPVTLTKSVMHRMLRLIDANPLAAWVLLLGLPLVLAVIAAWGWLR